MCQYLLIVKFVIKTFFIKDIALCMKIYFLTGVMIPERNKKLSFECNDNEFPVHKEY